MSKFYLRTILFLLGGCFCIFFGVDLASRGMERIEAPAARSAAAVKATSAPTPVVPAVKPAADAVKPAVAAAPAAKPPTPEPTRVSEDNSMNYIGNKLGDLLQIAAHHSIKLVVSLFEGFIG